MTIEAISMMLLAMLIVWGGLLWSVLYLRKHKLPDDVSNSDALHTLAQLGEERLGGFMTHRADELSQ